MSAALEDKIAVSLFFMQDDLLTKIIKKLYDGAGGLHYPCVDLWRSSLIVWVGARCTQAIERYGKGR